MPKRRPEAAGGGVPRRLFVDSSGWIAFFSANDDRHQEADAMIGAAARERVALLTSNLVLAEVHRLVLHRVGIVAARTVLERIEGSPLVSLRFATEAHHQMARRWLARLSDQEITYTDAVSFGIMQESRCTTVLGFDGDFAIAGFALWRSPA